MANDRRILIKLRGASTVHGLAASRANLRPLHDPDPATATRGLDAEPRWFLADLERGLDEASDQWDMAYGTIARQLGVADSDVLFAEPDLDHEIYLPREAREKSGDLALSQPHCEPKPQDSGHGKTVGDELAWHLSTHYSQLGSARDAVDFTDPRTRIAHIDTGYDPQHATRPEHLLTDLEHNFVAKDKDSDHAADPDNRRLLLDNSGHGTGTLSILAGTRHPQDGVILGEARAHIIPLRIADSVFLFRTSALAQALAYARLHQCDVVSLSMGGLPSGAWNDEINKAYEAGMVVVAAAGNNANGLPTRHIIYPARYKRVIAVCGIMFGGRPYINLDGLKTLEGNYGPKRRMDTAIAAYTPNIPWAVYHCSSTVRLDGEGTSAATPQVAAAAALWLEKYKGQMQNDWRRVEAVRHALFSSTDPAHEDKLHLGRGALKALDALAVKPRFDLAKTPSERDFLSFLRVITGLGIDQPTARERMLNLELAQRWLLNPEMQKLVPDPDAVDALPTKLLRQYMDAVIDDSGASRALRSHVANRSTLVTGQRGRGRRVTPAAESEDIPLVTQERVASPKPLVRRLRVFAVDPSRATALDTAATATVALKVRWEKLAKGPVGEYLAVEDSGRLAFDDDQLSRDKRAALLTVHAPVNLNSRRLLAQDGCAPAEGNPQFHQQMVYAVAMKTIEHFERALGRPVLWRHGSNPERPNDDGEYRQRLHIHPHALWQPNAYYSPEDGALNFGYFDAASDDTDDGPAGGRVYTCLSYDIVAHETTHAILDGMHWRLGEPTNPDVLAFHEGFADIVALLQRFTLADVLEREIARTRGNLEAESILGSLAMQLGPASGGRGALREAIGQLKDGRWKRLPADPTELSRRATPHARGAILVAAIFDALIAIHRARTADLLRIYTGGTGVLPRGAVHPDLVRRLAEEAAKAAGHVLSICIRALDYLPPVDLTFGEYLRALITADLEVVGEDRFDYRVAFVEAFRRRGIFPGHMPTLSVDTLRWQPLDLGHLKPGVRSSVARAYKGVVGQLRDYANACFYLTDREKLFRATRDERRRLHKDLKQAFSKVPEFAKGLGIEPGKSFEVASLRRAMHATPDGRQVPQVIVALTQSRLEQGEGEDRTSFRFRSGSTLVVDLVQPGVKYVIVKGRDSVRRLERTRSYTQYIADDPLRMLFLGGDRREPFAAVHALAE